MGTLSQIDVFELKICLENFRSLDLQIKQVDEKIASRVNQALVEKLRKPLPGITPTTAAVKEKGIAGWVGLPPHDTSPRGRTKFMRERPQANKRFQQNLIRELLHNSVIGRRGRYLPR